MKKGRLTVLVILPAFLAAFFTLGLIHPRPTPAHAIPPAWLCHSGNSGGQYTDGEGVVWICKCAKPVPEWAEVCAWVHKLSTANQRAKNGYFISRSTNSGGLVSSIISHHVGGAGNFGQSDISIFGSGGNSISRPIGARVIVAYLAGSWEPCHDSNWHYAGGAPGAASASHFAWREPANCNPHQYRAQAAGRYWSNTLGTWLSSGFVVTPTMCIPSPANCGV